MEAIQDQREDPDPLESWESDLTLTKENCYNFEYSDEFFSINQSSFLDFNARPLTTPQIKKILSEINSILKIHNLRKSRVSYCYIFIFLLLLLGLVEMILLTFFTKSSILESSLSKEINIFVCLSCYALLIFSYFVYCKIQKNAKLKNKESTLKVFELIERKNLDFFEKKGFILILKVGKNELMKFGDKFNKKIMGSAEEERKRKFNNFFEKKSLYLVNFRRENNKEKVKKEIETLMEIKIMKKKERKNRLILNIDGENEDIYETESKLMEEHETNNPNFEYSNAEYKFPPQEKCQNMFFEKNYVMKSEENVGLGNRFQGRKRESKSEFEVVVRGEMGLAMAGFGEKL